MSAPLDWRPLFVSSDEQSLAYFPLQVLDGEVTVKPLADVLVEGGPIALSRLLTPVKDKKSVDKVVEDSVFDNITTDSVVADSIVAHEESGKGNAVVISPSPPPKKQVHFSSSSNWFEVLGSKLSNLPVLLDATDAESTTATHPGCGIVIIMVKG
ncbi:hypothetical protein PVK06_044320 [Gossypium arboreum]|uniref:Uncharacterized protein n=1 Tax=Gossypium arboreum TaxID=29729 RepID=A0ABR0MQV1_GOSAR|nr:hypothetical protein PVK06_044320 [Gossypium arboreum]